MRFFRSDSGYALVLTLLFMPVFVGMSLLVIDISRGNNAHSDLQAAADALALAGARELDGSPDSITRALLAMQEIDNTVSFLGRTDEDASILLTFGVEDDPDEFVVVFLSDMVDDDQALTQQFLSDNAVTVADDQSTAEFVYVRAQSDDLSPFFGLFFTGVNPVVDVPIAAQAVATYLTAACNVTPVFICNPFETDPLSTSPEPTLDLQDAFNRGDLHGRLIRLLPDGGSTAGPGNFGLLRTTEGNGVPALRDIFSTGGSRTCYSADTVQTQTGNPVAIRTGINTRMDIYDSPLQNARLDPAAAPAANVRKGYVYSGANGCSAEPTTDETWAMGFPDNEDMEPPGVGTSGAEIGVGDSNPTDGIMEEIWDLTRYWNVNHPGTALTQEMIDAMTSRPGMLPSRYNVYRYEIETGNYPGNYSSDLSAGDGSGQFQESGRPVCSLQDVDTSREGDRRIFFAAIIDCLAADTSGNLNGQSEVPVNSYASVFLVNPMDRANSDPSIDVEIVDITGSGGGGTLDTFVRNEAVLVR